MAPSTITRPVPLDALVADTHGITTTPELHLAGYSDDAIRNLVRRGHLLRVRRGVFAVGHLALGVEARRMVVVRCAGDGALISSISAGRCWQLTNRQERLVDVVVPRARRRVADGNVVIDAELPRDAATSWRGIPIVTPTWSIVTMAPRMEPGELARVLREASYRQLLDMPALVRIAEEGRRRVGVPTLRRALELRVAGSDGFASALESKVHRYISPRVLEQPLPNARIAVQGDALRVDLVWRAFGVCCEVDGPLHDDPDVQREDTRRTKLLEDAGWIVIRIHWTAWEADRAAATRALIHVINARCSERNRRM